MRYLFGDSTASTLEVNFIEFLRDAVDFSVQVLMADQRIVQGRAHTRSLEQATAAEMERLLKLPPVVAKAFEGVPLGAADSASARCVAAISRSAGDLAKAEAVALRSALETEVAKRDAQAGQEREGCVKALETLLLKHDLPDTTRHTHLALHGGRYQCRALIKTGAGLEAVLDLEIPANHLFERVVRVDRLAERLDVHAPEIGGWLHKEVKRRPQHLEKHHLSELSIGPAGGTLKLRAAPEGTGPGFDVLFSKQAPQVRMARVEQGEAAASEPPFDVEDADAAKLLALLDKLAAAVTELGGHRRKLIDAKIDGEPMRTHAKPTLLVERLIANMAPVVQEISSRSQSPGELVLRRLLSGDRREEVFLSKSELKLKLKPLVDGNRALFDPLWVNAVPAAPPAKPAVPSAPAASQPSPVEPARGRQTPSIGISVITTATMSPSPAAPPATETPRPQLVRPRPVTPTSGVQPAPAGTLGDVFRRTLLGTPGQADFPPIDPAPNPPPAESSRTVATGTIDGKRTKAADS